MRSIKGHTKKLNPLARQIVGLSANEAIAQMAFAPQRRAKAVKQAIERAAYNADFYTGLSQNELMVERAWTGKNLTSVRMRYHSKGRAGRAHYRTSQLSVRLRQMTPDEAEKLNRFDSRKRPTAASKAALHPRGY